jgi:hypothetical protein
MPCVTNINCTEIYCKNIESSFGAPIKCRNKNTKINESGPWTDIISAIIPNDPLPDRGRIIAMGSASAGIPIKLVTGCKIKISHPIAPPALKIPIATSIATRKGMILIAILNPSFAPSTNFS